MRVISGSCRGRRLKAVPGLNTRPTADKVKSAIFNMIGPYFHGGIGLDLFAGSGALGIEGLSRGLDQVIFVERDPQAARIVKENVHTCGLNEKVEVYRNTADKALKAISKRSLKCDYIFLDPPFKKEYVQQLLETIAEENVLAQNGVIVCEHESTIQLPEQIGSFTMIKNEQYGAVGVTIYTQAEKIV